MVQVLERPEVREHEGDTMLHEAPPRDVPQVEPDRSRVEAAPPATKRPVRWMRWLTLGIVPVVAAIALVVVLQDSGTPTTTSTPTVATHDYRTADGWDRYLTAVSMGTLDYRTADGFERVLATVQPVMNDTRTADGWERYLDHITEVQVELISKW